MFPCCAGWLAWAVGGLSAPEGQAAAVELDVVVVTGSRIPVQPGRDAGLLVVVDDSDLRRWGSESLGDTLQKLPANTGSPANSGFNAAQEDQGGDGSTRIDLRGLGPERTLVLLDGRRMAPGGLGGDAAVDLGMIPLSAVERVEVLGAGASSIYGADAIGGVVNVITRQPAAAQGEVALSGSLSSSGDGGSGLVALRAGHDFARGGVAGGVEWYRQEEVWMSDRDYSRERQVLMADGTAIAFGLAQTPQGYFRVPPSNVLGLPGGIYTRVEQSGEPSGPEDFRPFIEPDDRYNPNADEYLRTPLERWTVWLNADYDLGDSTRAGMSAMLHARQSTQLLRPAPIDTRFGIGIPVLPNGRPGIPWNHFYNPFGIDMLDVRRRMVEAGRRRYEQDLDAARWVVTLGRDAAAGWSWEAAAGWSRNDTQQDTTGELRSDSTILALGPSGLDDSGLPVCGIPDPLTGRVPAANVIAGCVPLNLFGGQGADGLGSVDAGQLDYVTDRFRDRGRNEQWIADIGAHGDWGEGDAGPIGWAVGLEYRHESGYHRTDPDKAAGVSGSVTGDLSNGGSYSAFEAFGEARVPLLSQRPAIERLDLELGVRWSDFTSFGSRANSSARLRWQPATALLIEAGYSEVFRAPPLASLHSSTVRFLSVARDPCGNYPDSVQAANCAANGVPGGSYVQPLFDQTPTIRGGNPDLEPEDGQSWSAGLAWSPPGGDVSLALGYWDTVVHSAIRQLSDQTLLNACANTGAAEACARIERAADGTLTLVDSRYLNLGSEAAQGVDFDARSRVDWPGASATLRLVATHLIGRSITTSPGATPLEVAGARFERSLYPEWRGLASVELARGPWSFGYNAEYIGSVRECSTSPPLIPGMLTGCRQIADVLYHDLRFSYTADAGWSAALLVTNLGDEDPPRVAFGLAEGNTSTVTYRLLGRTFSLQFRYEPG